MPGGCFDARSRRRRYFSTHLGVSGDDAGCVSADGFAGGRDATEGRVRSQLRGTITIQVIAPVWRTPPPAIVTD